MTTRVTQIYHSEVLCNTFLIKFSIFHKILFLKLIAYLYPTSDFRHPVTTPALTLLIQAVSYSSLTSLSSCRQSLLLIELIKQVK